MTTVLQKHSCPHCLAPSRTIDAQLSAQADSRLFPQLPAFWRSCHWPPGHRAHPLDRGDAGPPLPSSTGICVVDDGVAVRLIRDRAVPLARFLTFPYRLHAAFTFSS